MERRTSLIEIVRVAGLALGEVMPEQWSVDGHDIEFFDIKSDLVAVMQTVGADVEFEFVLADHPALLPDRRVESFAVTKSSASPASCIRPLPKPVALRNQPLSSSLTLK